MSMRRPDTKGEFSIRVGLYDHRVSHSPEQWKREAQLSLQRSRTRRSTSRPFWRFLVRGHSRLR